RRVEAEPARIELGLRRGVRVEQRLEPPVVGLGVDELGFRARDFGLLRLQIAGLGACLDLRELTLRKNDARFGFAPRGLELGTAVQYADHLTGADRIAFLDAELGEDRRLAGERPRRKDDDAVFGFDMA